MKTSTMQARSSTIRATLAYLEKAGGTELVERVLRRLNPATRAEVESAGGQQEVRFELMSGLLRAADQELGSTEPDWSEQVGYFAIASSGTDLYGGILRKATPAQFLTQPVSLFRLYYQPGDMVVVQQDESSAVLRLVDFPHHNRLFCARQTGGLRAALEIAGGQNARVRHVRCTEEGDAFCEWHLSWTGVTPNSA